MLKRLSRKQPPCIVHMDGGLFHFLMVVVVVMYLLWCRRIWEKRPFNGTMGHAYLLSPDTLVYNMFSDVVH